MLKATIAGRTIEWLGCDTMRHADKLSRFPCKQRDAHQRVAVIYETALVCPKGEPMGRFDMASWYRLADDRFALYHEQGRFLMTYTADFSDVTLRLHPHMPQAQTLHYLYVSQCFAYHMLSCGAIAFHGAGLRFKNGNGILLVGGSGTGKSTLSTAITARDSAVTILNEEQTVVTQNGGPRLHGTPFCGQDDRCAALDAPLKAIVLLDRDTIDRFEKPPASKAFFGLLASAIRPVYQPTLHEAAVQHLEHILNTTPIYRFGHTAALTTADTLLSALAKDGRI